MFLNLLKNKKTKPYEGASKQVAFIVGTGRCGTTILAQVLNSHSKICVPHELQIIVGIGNGERFYEKSATGEMARYTSEDYIKLVDACCPYQFKKFFDYKKHFKKLDYPQRDLRVLLTGLFDHICFEKKKEVFIEQTPWYGQRLEILKSLFPEMKVIHIIRDGRDVAISFARTPWWSKDIASNLLQWGKEVNTIHEYGMKNPENFIELRYEDLVISPEAELKNVLALLGLEFEPGMLDPERLVDYASMFKGEFSENQSKDYKKWSENKKQIFFPNSLYAWKKKDYEEFKNIPGNVRETLRKFNYEA